MKRLVLMILVSAWCSSTFAEPFQEVTISVPVTSMSEAEVWYTKFLGSNVEILRPAPGVIEYKIAPGTWLQIFEVEEGAPLNSILRLNIDDVTSTQQALKEDGIETGQVIEVPDIITYSEFDDPFGNHLGFYSIP